MTTITIENSSHIKDFHCSAPMEAMEELLESMGCVMLTPVEDESVLQRTEAHREENRGRSLDTYDDI